MPFPIVRMFRDFAAAERARDELLAAGFPRDAVELSALDDEAGPEKGNFTVGDDPTVKGGHDYRYTFAPDPTVQHFKLMVTASDKAQVEMADIILERHGATDADVARRGAAEPGTPRRG